MPRSGDTLLRASFRCLATSFLALFALVATTGAAFAQNEIVLENQLAGNPASEWDISGSGDASIQGFATDISVDQGQTIQFKVLTDATSYRIDIYRLGYYAGLGARKVATINPSVALPQNQPACFSDPATGLVDCGTWGVSASWSVPANAVSGVYIAKLVRTDPEDGRASHVLFVVRDDDGASNLLMQISETTYQAYNTYGGNSLYAGSATTPPVGRAHMVSFNRPFITRGGPSEDWVFNADYPMIRWIESNGYDVSYSTDTDTDRRGAELLEHQAFLSVGHDEYWSAGARANVEAARNAGVHLAFFSGNEIYWKVRWENSQDGSNTPFRTMVCYKEGTEGENTCGFKCDPLAATWTGLWRSGCPPTYGPNDGCSPENGLSGQISWDGSTSTILVPDDYKSLRFWANTAVATLPNGGTHALAGSSLGYEWDYEQFGAFYPAGRVRLSSTEFNGHRHHLSLYRHNGGALVFGAGTVQWSWGLDGTHDRGGSTPNTAMQQSTVNLFAEMGAQPGSIRPGLVTAVASGDVTPPSSAIGFPVNGGNVQSGATVTISGTATDAAGAVGGVEVSVDGGATWQAASGGANWTFSWTPGPAGSANIRSRGADDWGNLETPTAGITVTIDPPAPPVCPCNIWTASTVPGVIDAADGAAGELGVRFRANTDGFIEGIRFYKATTNTGTHVGNLWTNTGTPLGSATFTGETASGWQEVTFGAPVAVTAGVTYVASVFMPAGHYSDNNGYFASAGTSNPPLTALQDGVDGVNGAYRYSAVSTFPTDTYQSSNYWVDVVFNTTAAPDITPPLVSGITPGNGAIAVAVTANATATFNEPLDALTVDGTTAEMRGPGNSLVPAVVSYDTPNRRITVNPDASLAYSSTYTVTLRGGGADPRLKDVAGNALAADFVWSFTTASPPPPPPDEGPGGPILVISDAGNPFSRYFAEILRAEGLNSFTASDISLVNAGVLTGYDVAILGEMSLNAGQVTMLTNWVNAGGTLIAMRPDAQLASLLGIAPAAGTLAEGYLDIDNSGPGAGLVSETIQYHGAANLYSLSGASAIATLFSNATTPTLNPAVTLNLVGGNGGRAIAFAYDLARSIVYTRQGNPAWSGQERDGTTPIRSDDLFFGAAAGDPQSDWINLSKIAIPQADEQQRLLANLILTSNLHRKPLPRFWYFPKGKKAVVVMTGDNHASSGMAPRFDIYNAQSPPGCSAPNWECVRATGYLYVTPGFTDAQAAAYQAQGFEVALHVNTGCADWTQSSLSNDFATQMASFSAAYPSVAPLVTNRTHCIAWSDWSTQADVEVANGIRFDTNYYFWPPAWVGNQPGMFTGSGMPMRFARLDGSMIDCYQAATQMTDESGQSFPFTSDALLDKALGPEGYYGSFVANMHFDSSPHAGSDAIVASALARGVPVVSSRQMLDWLDGRNGSSFQNLTWAGNQLSFTLSVGANANNLRAMLPLQGEVGQLTSLTRNAVSVPFTIETIKGIAYAVFPAEPGNHVASYTVDAIPPVITALTATPHGDGTATISWTTDELSTSRVDYGLSAGSLTLNTSNATPVTSHSLLLTGLSQGTLYYFKATSVDGSSNSATEPAGSPLSFTTPSAPCATDATTLDFGGGSPGANTRVVTIVNGEVILAPAAGAEFGVLPPVGEWASYPWSGGGTSSVSGGQLVVDGARYNSEPEGATFGPGSSLEFVATFAASPFQHVGFGGGTDAGGGQMYNGPPWAMFSTGVSGAQLQARTHDGSTQSDVNLGGGMLGAPHRYRIEWGASQVQFYVDDALVHTQAVTLTAPMRPGISDFNVGGATVAVDWIRAAPYVAAGSYTSRVFDGGSTVDWQQANWNADLPSGTGVAILVRTGNSLVPDGTWTPFTTIPFSGGSVGASSRYLQYRADLTTSVATSTPVLRDVAVSCQPTAPDLTPPVISSVLAVPNAGGMTADVSWSTDELASSRVDFGTTSLLLDQNVTSGTLTASHGLALTGLTPSTVYYYRVTSVDAANNSATDPASPGAPRTFTTLAAPPTVCALDATDAHFLAGTLANTRVSVVGNGEVILAPAAGAEFAVLPPTGEWNNYPWSSGGTSTISGGQLLVDGSRFNSEPEGTTYGPGSSLEFVATFAAAPFQHIGFGGGPDLGGTSIYNGPPWAMFSTASGAQLQARTHNGSAQANVNLGASYLGTTHRYRIVWGASQVDFYIDGVLAHSEAVVLSAPMRPAFSDFNVGGPTLAVDWVRVLPYATPGTFTSRVHDAGTEKDWGSMSWGSDVPVGTTLGLEVRTGNTAVPDGSWTPFSPVPSSGTPVGQTARYLQYRAQLATTDPLQTPVLNDVSVECSAPASHTLAVSVVGSGSVAKNPSLLSYPHGSIVELTATPGVGYTFTAWSGDATGAANPLNLVMDANKSITATFTVNSYALTVNTVGSGSVARNPDQPTYDHGTSVQLTATAGVGYTFAGWSGAATGVTNPVSVLMDGPKTVTATFTINAYTLTVNTIGNGTVSRTPDAPTYNHGTSVDLTATAGVGYSFTGWSGDATGAANPVTVLMNAPKSVTATFTINTYALNVNTVGIGTVTRAPDQPAYNYGTTVDLTAAAGTGYTFTGWSGAATGTANPVTVLMDGVKTVTATFTINTYTLTVNTIGSGTVARSPDQPTYDHGTSVDLTATPAVGWTFTAWSGDATGATNPVSVLMNGNKIVTATFTINTYTLTVNTIGSGTVSRNPDQPTYDHGTSVDLTAAPAVGWTFTAWSGDFSGVTNPLTVLMTQNRTVTATFTINTYTLTVNTIGSGTVARNPDQPTYDHGTSVDLTATPAVGWTFTAWSGDATGATNPVSVLMTSNKTVTATFTINTYTLTVNTIGSGTVARSPDQPTYTHGTSVDLTATPSVGWTFTAWSGDFSGNANPLTVLMTQNRTVTATFTINTYTLTVNTIGSGSVSKSPDQPTYNHGTSVDLTATPAVGWTFTAWSGDFTGVTNPLTVVMTQNRTVAATFTINTYTLTVNTVGSGTVARSPDQPTYDYGTNVQLTAAPASGWSFTGWSGAVTGAANPVSVLMDGNKSVTATFEFTASVVISQVYGGGGSPGVLYRNDFIELFNRSGVTVDLTGWSVQYATATGSGWQTTALSGSIAPGGYYLVQELAGPGGAVTLPAPDAVGTIGMVSTGGKVALVTNGTALSGTCPSGLVDLIGYGPANCFETAAAAALTNSTAALRNGNGCIETDHNLNDFAAGAPTPRNSASPVNTCSYMLSVSASPGAGGSVTRSPDQPSYAYGTIVQVTATPAPGYSFTGWSGDGSGVVNPLNVVMTGSKTVVALFSNTTAGDVVISQVYGGGGESGAAYTHDYIELFNRGNAATSVDGWSIQYASAGGATWEATTLEGFIPAGGYYLVRQGSGGGSGSAPPAPDATGPVQMDHTNGKVALVSNAVPLSGSCPTGVQVLDLVGYGTANCAEGSAAAAIDALTALFRRDNGCQDTDDNLADFQVQAPAARNSGTPVNPCGPPVAVGDNAVLAFAVNPVMPNPTPGAMRVTFALPRSETVRIHLMDIQGRVVAQLAEATYPAGKHEIAWNGAGRTGPIRTGVYFVQVQAGAQTRVRRVVVTN